MNEITIANLTLDTYQRNRIPPLIVPQGDYGARVIRAVITEQGKPVTVESAAAVSIVAERSGDGEALAFSGKVNTDGSVTVPVTQWMLDVPEDDVTCHIVVTGIGYQYSTTSFLIEPQEKANPTEIAPDDPRQDLVTEVMAGENTRRAAEAERVSNENARIAAENARQSAETQRLTDEATRITNEAQRVSAEASRDATFKSWAQDIASLPTFDGRISANRKRIENLESGIPAESFIIDDSVAYTKDVPENVAPNAVVTKLGGMTYKSKNLFDIETAPIDKGNVIIGDNTLQVITDLTICEISKDKLTIGKTYKLSGIGGAIAIEVKNANGDIISSQYGVTLDSNNSVTITEETNVLWIYFYKEAGLYRNIMLNEGSTALPYEPYFEGLRSAKVTAVKSVGQNLIPFPYISTSGNINGVTATINTDQSITISGTPTVFSQFRIFNGSLKLTKDSTISAKGLYGGSIGIVLLVDGVEKYLSQDNDRLLLSAGSTITIININISASATGTHTISVMLNEGSTAEPYTPYVEHTLPILDEVRPANGINENVYDFIEWAEDGSVKQTVQCKKAVFDGSPDEYWMMNQFSNLSAYIIPFPNETLKGGIICDKFEVLPHITGQIDGTIGVSVEGVDLNNGGVFFGVKGLASSVEEWRNYLANNPVTVVIALANPIVTDISDLITADNRVPVQSGGTMTPVNEYSYAVPSTIIYQSR